MKTVVITGSSQGLGFEMAKLFRKKNFNVVLNGTNPDKLRNSASELEKIASSGAVAFLRGSVAEKSDMQALMDLAIEKFGKVDIWINNAGVNQPNKPMWELTDSEINALISIDLSGAINGSHVAMKQFSAQGEGAVYNLEGYGSNDAHMLGLGMYGTAKRAVTYYTQSLALEAAEMNTGVIVGRLSPGIMITDFTVKALGKETIELPEKTKKVYNILGDYPDVVAKFLVRSMIKNKKNDVHIQWLTGGKAAWRFMTAGFNKRNFFD